MLRMIIAPDETVAQQRIKFWQDLADQNQRNCDEALARIRKAREILQKASDSADYLHRSTLLKAINALEGKPLVCQECGQDFRPGSAHPRKYCSYECAHRATDRDWHRRKRGNERAG